MGRMACPRAATSASAASGWAGGARDAHVAVDQEVAVAPAAEGVPAPGQDGGHVVPLRQHDAGAGLDLVVEAQHEAAGVPVARESRMVVPRRIQDGEHVGHAPVRVGVELVEAADR